MEKKKKEKIQSTNIVSKGKHKKCKDWGYEKDKIEKLDAKKNKKKSKGLRQQDQMCKDPMQTLDEIESRLIEQGLLDMGTGFLF